MFSPDEKKNDSVDNYITLSSTHRFKGLERDHAFLLLETYKPGRNQEETNLMYVAQTRAKKQLTYVCGDVKQIAL
jgi:superfamily I DNA/RNA helicase